ncbi:MAG: hypothetical protein ABIR15_00245 [Chitinophagaceae bacterium]
MKTIVFLLLFVLSLSSYAQNNFESIDEKKVDSLLDKMRLKQATGNDKKELEQIAILIQNKGQDLEEKQHQSKKALATIEKAIVVFTMLGDTLAIANNRKYKGYLSGRLGKFREARNETKTAIDLYRLKNMNAEIAVSQFDLARMFEFENKTDSAIYCAEQSRTFWKSKEVDLRVLIINNMMVSLLLKSNQPEKAKFVQEESQLLVKKPQMHWQAIIDFYFTSMLLYKTMNDMGVASDYRQLYNAKIIELRKEGIDARSYYESDN